MKTSKHKVFKLFISWLFLALFLGLWSSNHLFFHNHIVNSQVVSHSHPYLPGQSHSHSNIEFQWIAANASLIALAFFFLIPKAFFQKLFNELSFFIHLFTSLFKGTIRLLRAPPLAFSI